jgi:SAM-dependent methyltransferase
VIEREDGKALYGKRDKKRAKEYKEYWSIPSMPIDHAEYSDIVDSKRLSDTIAKRFARTRLAGIRLNGGRLIISGSRQRTKYLLHMAVFNATTNDPLPTRTSKYEEFKFFSPAQFLEVSGRICGTCSSLYLQSLVNRGVLPSTVEYLEISPEIADSDRKLENYSPDELWRLAGQNYSLLLEGKIGGDGHFIRSLTLDRFLDSFIRKEIKRGVRVLDLGCGEGRFLEKIGNRTEFARGLELVESVLKEQRIPLERVKVGNLYDASKIFRDLRFDWVVLNLMLQYIPNLNKAARVIRSLLVENGKVLVTMTTPEFTKNGQWIKEKDKFNWFITKPLRRERVLAMINRLVGPVWLYPRSTIDFLNIFGKNRLYCIDGQHIYLDTYLSPGELSKVLKAYPSLIRHEMLPAFTVLKFVKI